MRISFTGHRKFNGYKAEDNKELIWKLHDAIIYYINKGYNTFYCGGAIGFDTWSAKIICKIKEINPDIKLVIAAPCRNQELKWPKKAIKEYREILEKADEVVYVSENYDSYCMQKRNIYLVGNCDVLIAGYLGGSGGTKNCIDYAKKQGKLIHYIKL